MGSVLALHLSSIFPLNAAVFTSTVLQFKDKFEVRIFIPLFHRFYPYSSKQNIYPKEMRDTMEYFGYDVWPLTAVNEMRKLTNKVRKVLPKIKCPALVIHSKVDLLSPQSNISLVYDTISSENKEKMIVENGGHNLFISNPYQKTIFKKIAVFLNQFCEK